MTEFDNVREALEQLIMINESKTKYRTPMKLSKTRGS